MDPSTKDLQNAERVFHACGLRFDGYGYVDAVLRQERGDAPGNRLLELKNEFTLTRELPARLEDAFAALFCHQRSANEHGCFLNGKQESLAGAELFLHLWQVPTPAMWRWEPYAEEWDHLSLEQKEAAATTIRHWLRFGEEISQEP